MHSLQRTFKSKFDKLYIDYWNFERGKVKTEKEIKLNQVSNPDAPIPEWLIKNKNNFNEFYWVRTLLNKSPKIPESDKQATNLANAGNAFNIPKNEVNKNLMYNF